MNASAIGQSAIPMFQRYIIKNNFEKVRRKDLLELLGKHHLYGIHQNNAQGVYLGGKQLYALKMT